MVHRSEKSPFLLTYIIAYFRRYFPYRVAAVLVVPRPRSPRTVHKDTHVAVDAPFDAKIRSERSPPQQVGTQGEGIDTFSRITRSCIVILPYLIFHHCTGFCNRCHRHVFRFRSRLFRYHYRYLFALCIRYSRFRIIGKCHPYRHPISLVGMVVRDKAFFRKPLMQYQFRLQPVGTCPGDGSVLRFTGHRVAVTVHE